MASLTDVDLVLTPKGEDHHTATVTITVAFEPKEVTLGTAFRAVVPLFGEDPFVDEHLQTELSDTFKANEGENPRTVTVSFDVLNTVLDEDIFGEDEVFAHVELYADRSTGLELVEKRKSQVIVKEFGKKG